MADLVTPVRIKFFLEENGQPFNEPLNFDINCPGFKSIESTDLEIVYTIHVDCPQYGCSINHSLYVPRGSNIIQCNIIGKTKSGRYIWIEHYSDGVIPPDSCKKLERKDDSDLMFDCELRLKID